MIKNFYALITGLNLGSNIRLGPRWGGYGGQLGPWFGGGSVICRMLQTVVGRQLAFTI
jgi:hypothetical protein